MIDRLCTKKLNRFRKLFPAVAILGPRQCGKTTLAKMLLTGNEDAIYMDLESLRDLSKLNDPELFFEMNNDKEFCLDEIQRKPELFSALRSIIDRNRVNGKFLILGSATPHLLKQSSETLAGRIGYIELTPFLLEELQKENGFNLYDYWLKGGYPLSYLNEASDSFFWRLEFIKTYIERNIPQLGFSHSSTNLMRFLMMVAHQQGQIMNYSTLGNSLGVSYHSIQTYAHIFEEAFIGRNLEAFSGNLKKRLTKSPKYYIRDTGILHALLRLEDFNSLLGHPVYGNSWETLVIENIISTFPEWKFSFYRTASGNEIDLVIETGKKIFAVECKANTAPKLSKGFWQAIEDIKADKAFVIIPTADVYPIKENVVVCGLSELLKLLKEE